MNAELLRLNLGGDLNETDVVKEAIRSLSVEQVLSLVPQAVLKSQQERHKTNTVKYEAVNIVVRLLKCLQQRLRSIILVQNKIA